VRARLDRLDGAIRHGPWTATVLRLIAERPAAIRRPGGRVGPGDPTVQDRRRKLERLGLTESLDVGFRLSPRGRAVLERIDGA
jgi:hypothetical protein